MNYSKKVLFTKEEEEEEEEEEVVVEEDILLHLVHIVQDPDLELDQDKEDIQEGILHLPRIILVQDLGPDPEGITDMVVVEYKCELIFKIVIFI